MTGRAHKPASILFGSFYSNIVNDTFLENLYCLAMVAAPAVLNGNIWQVKRLTKDVLLHSKLMHLLTLKFYLSHEIGSKLLFPGSLN